MHTALKSLQEKRKESGKNELIIMFEKCFHLLVLLM